MQTSFSQLPIGVFDSGIGGLTVLKELAEHFPFENFIYLGDTARLPYGSKSPETIATYSRQNMNYLYSRGVKAIVIACNSASSHCPVDQFHGVPVYNVIDPGAKTALQATLNGRIGVLGTRATVTSNSYLHAIQRQTPSCFVVQQACPLFVPLAEEGLIDDPVTRIMGQRYLSLLLAESVDTIILGCTHYPILKPTLETLVNPSTQRIQWIDSGSAMAQLIQKEFQRGQIQPNDNLIKNVPSALPRTIEVITTDSSQQFITMAHRILEPISVSEFSLTDLRA